MTKAIIFIVAFTAGIFLGHVQAGEWDKQRKDKIVCQK